MRGHYQHIDRVEELLRGAPTETVSVALNVFKGTGYFTLFLGGSKDGRSGNYEAVFGDGNSTVEEFDRLAEDANPFGRCESAKVADAHHPGDGGLRQREGDFLHPIGEDGRTGYGCRNILAGNEGLKGLLRANGTNLALVPVGS